MFVKTLIEANILSTFSGCLSLAELGRRGLLLPQRLPDGKSRFTPYL